MTFAEPPTTVSRTDRIGFTPFAYDHLIGLTNDGADGFAIDLKKRVYVLGGTVEGARVRREVSGTITTVFAVYIQDPTVVRLWVMWKDGRRHLVHRKS